MGRLSFTSVWSQGPYHGKRAEEKTRDMAGERRGPMLPACRRRKEGRGHEPRNVNSLGKLEKTRGRTLPWSLQKEESLPSPWFWPGRPMLDFWPPKLQGNTSVLFEDIKLQVIYCGSHRKQIPTPTGYFLKITFITQAICEYSFPLKTIKH